MMNDPTIQILVLAGVAIFLVLKLRSVLGSREGFEHPVQTGDDRPVQSAVVVPLKDGRDYDILDHVPEGSDMAPALAEVKKHDKTFEVKGFLQGARSAYEMILMAFNKGDLSSVRFLLADDVSQGFERAIAARAEQGLAVEANFVGLREMTLHKVHYDAAQKLAEISVRFVGELNYVVRNNAGDIVEGNMNEIKRQHDIWTFARLLGNNDPNWQLVATGE